MKQILDLTTGDVEERPQVRIVSKAHPDGKLYEMHTPGQLGVVAHRKLARAHQFIEGLDSYDPADLTDDDAKRLAKSLDDVVGIVLIGVEWEVLRALSDGQKAQILNTYQTEFDLAAPPEEDG